MILLSVAKSKIPVRNKVIFFLNVLCAIQYATCLLGALLANKLSYV